MAKNKSTRVTWRDVGEWMQGLPFVGGFFSNLVGKDKADQFIKMTEAQSVINAALSKAQSIGENALNQVTNALARLDFVRSSPVLDRAVESRRKRLNVRADTLRNDIAELNLVGAKATTDLESLNDNTNLTNKAREAKIKEATNNAKKQIENIEEKI